MGDKWQLEAVQQQFEVFENLKTPYTVIAVENFRALIDVVKPVIDQHYQLNNNITVALKKICAEIIKNTNENQTQIKLSYVVIVLNREFNRSLAKIPVFTIISGNQRLFIDINCSLYKNWNAFIKSNSLPACEFCHPVDGQYNVGGKLKIDFAKSPATLKVSRLYSFVGKLVLCAGVIASTFFIRIPQTVFKRARDFIGIAQDHFPRIPFRMFLELAVLVDKLKRGDIKMVDFFNAFKLLQNFCYEHKDDIALFWEEVQSRFKSLCSYIRKQLERFFTSASPTSQQRFLAITHEVDTEISSLEEETQLKLNDAYDKCENTGNTSGQFSGSSIDVIKTTVPATPTSGTETYVHDIFKNCKNDISHNGQKDSKNDMISSKDLCARGTQELLNVSINVANHLQKENLSDVENIFSSLSSVIKNEYNLKIDNYIKILNAARAGAGHEIDIQSFNSSLGIKGDPKDHYWNETVKCIQEHRFSFQIKKNMDEIRKKNDKILLIPESTVHEGGVEGFYQLIGIQGKGRISAADILNCLKEILPCMNEKDVVINESNPEQILIIAETYTIVAYQNTHEYNTAEGMVFIVRR